MYSRSNPLFIMRKRASLSWERAPSVYCDATVGNPPVLHCPHSFLIFLPNLRRNSHLESPLTSVFSSTTLRNSAVTTPSPLTRKSTTLRWTLWCSHYSVAKGQQFSCPLGTANLSLTFENGVQVVGFRRFFEQNPRL